MMHEWKSHKNPDTPDGPGEWIQYCDACGVEADGDNEDGECVLLPEIGETVLYALEGGEVAPAMVTRIHPDGLTVNLRVMLDVSAVDAGEVPEYWTREWLERTGYCPPESGVRYDAKGEGGTWRREVATAPILPPYEG